MRKIMTAIAALFLTVGFTSVVAKAQSGSIGCGGGNGASVACNGTVTENSNPLTVSSTGVDTTFTSISGLPSNVSSLPIFTTDEYQFSFSNVGLSFSDGGTFQFTDLTEVGALTVGGEAELGNSIPSLTGPLTLVLDATSFKFEGISGTLSTMGSATLELDPGNVMSMTGSIGLPNVSPSPTPEPGTLLLLGSGLTGLGFIRRRFVRA